MYSVTENLAMENLAMENLDIRWIQRFDNFRKAFEQLGKFIKQKELNELEVQGLIQSFEYNYELSWNTIKDYFEHQGETDIFGSRDAFRLAFKRGLIENGDIWMDMIKSRALTSHTYNREAADQIVEKIRKEYYPEFGRLKEKFDGLVDTEKV
jgi:nucleotidyltransferase substrate binding protein (TIGR01987 family)